MAGQSEVGEQADQQPGCVFCDIVARRSPANIRYEDKRVIVIDNVLQWAPLMLLVMPKGHMTQEQLWSNGMIQEIGRTAVAMGRRFCPKGYRLISNFGRDAMQSQEHGHVHVLGGMHLGPYA